MQNNAETHLLSFCPGVFFYFTSAKELVGTKPRPSLLSSRGQVSGGIDVSGVGRSEFGCDEAGHLTIYALSLFRFHDSISVSRLFFFFFFPSLEVDFLKSLLLLQNCSSATLLLRVIICFLNS